MTSGSGSVFIPGTRVRVRPDSNPSEDVLMASTELEPLS